MVDKAFSFFLFFVFLFFILFQFKNVLLNKFEEEITKENYIKIQKSFINEPNISIFNCQKIVEKNVVEVISNVNDNVNPKINGYSLITEPVICELDFPLFNTTINYSFN